jgi:hypothetical protein
MKTDRVKTGWFYAVPAALNYLKKKLGLSKLSESDINLLHLMREDTKISSQPFIPSSIWVQIGQHFENMFHKEGINNVEQQNINRLFSCPFPSNPKLLRYATYLLYRDLKKRDELGLLARLKSSASSESGLAFCFNNHYVSWDILISLDTLYRIYEYDKKIFEDTCVVADLVSCLINSVYEFGNFRSFGTLNFHRRF